MFLYVVSQESDEVVNIATYFWAIKVYVSIYMFDLEVKLMFNYNMYMRDLYIY